jgi:IMP dehydrogenase
MTEIKLALTYNDVLLVPKRTPLKSRKEADVSSRFTRNIPLQTPLVSANMATVTEHQIAIAMARSGGLGIIHQFGTKEEQAEEVRKVKRSTSYIVSNPEIAQPTISLKQALEIMRRKGISSLIIAQGNQLLGILTSRDYIFEQNLDVSISELMTPREKLIIARDGITLEEAKHLIHKHGIEKIPLVENGNIIGLITKKDIQNLEAWPKATRDGKGRLRVGAAVGVKDTIERSKILVEAGVDVIVLDLAHCHSDYAVQRIRELKQQFPSVDVMAGNIATGEAAKDLIEAGADGLKVGIGPSPVCTTRIMSGSGYPQLTAVMNVVEVAKKFGVPVSADGGMRYPGDVAKAIAAGADTAFSGTLFAGTKESPGIIIYKEGKRYKKYMGSASYDSNHQRKEKIVGKKVKHNINVFVEGVSKLVDYKGPVEGVINSLIKGLQSGISYCGARNIPEMQQNAEFVRITSSGWRESLSR